MATTFKVYTKSSAVTDAVPNITNANNDIYQVPGNTDTVIIGLLLANKLGSSIVADVAIVRDTDGAGGSAAPDDVYLIKGAQVPVGSALEVVSGKIVISNLHASTLALGDKLQVRCDTASALDVTLSILENTG